MESASVGEDFPRQQERCRGILEMAKSIGPAGSFLVAMLTASLARAERAATSGDVVEILRSYEDLRSYKE